MTPPAAAPRPSGHQAPEFAFVPHLPDLIEPDEYDQHPDGRLVRIRITASAEGVQVLGDGFRPSVVEQLLAALGGGPIEEMLCG